MEGEENLDMDNTHETVEDAKQTAPAAPVVGHTQEDIQAIVDTWVKDRIHNSPLARSTEAYAHLKSELGELIKRLMKGD